MVKSMLKVRAEKVANLIREYREVKYARLESVEKVEDLVFYLLEKTRFKENLKLYPAAVASLHKLLHHEEVARVMRRVLLSEERTAIPKLLFNLHHFFEVLREEQNETLFEEKHVRYHYADDSLQALIELEGEYRAKLDAYLKHNGASA
jgi:hypothetical protein